MKNPLYQMMWKHSALNKDSYFAQQHPYTVLNALSTYRIYGYSINDSLRRGQKLDTVQQSTVQNLEEAFKKTTLQHIDRVYRFLRCDDIAQTLNDFKVNTTFVDPAFVSTTISSDVLYFFRAKAQERNRSGIALVIDNVNDQGVSLEDHVYEKDHIQSYEHEVLLNRNLKYRITSVSPREQFTLTNKHNWGAVLHSPLRERKGKKFFMPTVHLSIVE